MKLIFSVLALILFDSTINALSCIDPDQSFIISDDFTLTAIQDKLDQLKPNTRSAKCPVQIIFDYYEQSIEIYFGTVYYVPTKYPAVFVATSIQLAKNTTDFSEGNIMNTVEFVCDDADGCDLRFVRHQLKWLFKVNYNELISAIRPLLMIEEENTDQLCIDYDQNKQQNCIYGACYFHHKIIKNSIHGGCLEKEGIWMALTLHSYIITDENIYKEEEQTKESPSIPQIAKLDMSMQYECAGNKCNNQTSVELVKKAVKHHYDLSVVYKVLNVKIEEDSEENPESTAISTEISTTSSISRSTTIPTKIDTTSPIPHSTTTKKPDTTSITTYGTTTTKTNSTTVSILTMTEQQNNIATSLQIPMIVAIINLLLYSIFNLSLL